MEADLSLLGQIKKEFQCKEVDVRAYSPLTLAYIGDAVYEMIIRTVIVERANKAANELHKKAVKFVQAGTQAAMIMALQDLNYMMRRMNAVSITTVFCGVTGRRTQSASW